MTARLPALLLACLLLLAGCSTGERRPGPPAPAPQASGYFVGRTPGGLGVAVDLAGFDPTAQAVSTALLDYPRPVALAIVSMVNDGDRDVPAPELVARTRSGRLVPLVDVRVLLARLPEASAQAARKRLQPAPGVLAAGTSSLRYLGAVDVAVPDVDGIRMVASDAVMDLQERRR
ncbi:MAG: hypothetical protein U0237_12540 [Thermoleophilia bacterium]